MKKVFYEVFSFSSIKLCAHNMEISKKLGMPELYLHSVYPRRLEDLSDAVIESNDSRGRAKDLGWRCDEKDRI